jgi:hypothetical protein
MKLLKNQQEFEGWKIKNHHNTDDDIVSNPKEFPCYVEWKSLTKYNDIAVYTYRHDIEKMLMSLLPPNATVKISTP